MENTIETIFKISLFITMMISFYILIIVLQNKNKYRSSFSAWTFPMLLAIFTDLMLLG